MNPSRPAVVALDHLTALAWHLRALVDTGPPERYRRGHLAPVVAIGGLAEPWITLTPAADRLNARGHPVVVADLGYNLGGLREAAAAVLSLLVEEDLTGVILLGHSKGGLIGKLALDLDSEGRIDRLIAIATPFHGSSLAAVVPLGGFQELVPGAAEVERLAGIDRVNSRIVSIAPAWDPRVPEGSWLEGAVNVSLPVSGHVRVLVQPSLLDAVVAAAGTGLG